MHRLQAPAVHPRRPAVGADHVGPPIRHTEPARPRPRRRVYHRSVPLYILAGMSKRLVDIDDDLLEEASALLGATTMKEAVNRSLESVVLAARRRRHSDRLEAMEGLDLNKPRVMSGAWR